MPFTTAELALVNQSLGRIGATQISDAENGSTACNNYVQSFLHYSQTRDSLLRSYSWNFAIGQAQLDLISVITLDTEPLPSAWVVGDIITGITSFVTAEILTVVSNTEYEIIYLSGDFTDGETITDATVEQVYWEGIELTWEDEVVLWYDDQTANQVNCETGYPVVVEEAPSFHYTHQFELPDDFLRMSRRRWRYPWTIQGHRLLSTGTKAKIEYVKQITDTTLFDSLFIEVLILTLALKLLGPLAGGHTAAFRQGLQAELGDAMARARTVCAAETNDTGASDWNLARYGSGKTYPLDPTRIY